MYSMNVVVRFRSISIKKPVSFENINVLNVCGRLLKTPIFTFFSSFLFLSRSSSDYSQRNNNNNNTTPLTDIMKKTVKLMISISNKSNPITTNTNLILNEIMRCLHQLQMLIS